MKREGPPRVYHVIKPVYGVPPPIAARSLAYHVTYHKPLGFAGHIVYCRRDEFLEYFLQDDKVTALVCIKCHGVDCVVHPCPAGAELSICRTCALPGVIQLYDTAPA